MLQCAKRCFPILSSFTSTPKSEDKTWLVEAIALANAVRAMHAPNCSGACIPIQSNFNLAQFDFYFEHYQDGIIVDFLRYGWPINYVGSLLSSTLSNHLSAAQSSIFLRSNVHKELAHHSICGPFTSNPFDTNCVISPLLCIPKRDSDEPRVAHDLSFPDGFSVNDGISMNHLDSVYPG